jgi:DNA invertase Pin-like site-specific DNA recombinase
MQTVPKIPRAALYARVSTNSQDTTNQLLELRDYVTRQNWTAEEYIDNGVSGSKASRPALDRLMTDARRRRFDVVIVWRLDRFGRSLQHIVTALDELHARGIAFISLGEGIDLSTPAGRLQLHILSALAEFERARIQERIHAGIARARAQGRRLGRKPRIHPKSAAFEDVVLNFALSGREAARRLGVAAETVNRLRRVHRRQCDQQSPLAEAPAEPPSTRVL